MSLSAVPVDGPTGSPVGRAEDERVDWFVSLPFIGVHLLAFFVLLERFQWSYLLWTAGVYFVGMFFITGAYHRYFSHRSYKTSRAFQFLLALGGSCTLQKGVLWWAAHHRHHHKHSDLPTDIHSPFQKGFWWSHVGWIVCRKYNDTRLDLIGDFAKYPELRWLDRYFLVPGVLYAIVLFALGGFPALFFGYFLGITLLWHGTFTVNSLAHVFGSRRYRTTDTSRNNLALALLTLGEGWHNNHHYYQSTANQGFFWWEVDISYYVLRAFAAVGLVWELRTPPRHILEGNRLDAPAGAPVLSEAPPEAA